MPKNIPVGLGERRNGSSNLIGDQNVSDWKGDRDAFPEGKLVVISLVTERYFQCYFEDKIT